MSLLNFCVYGFAILAFMHGIGIKSFYEIIAGVLIFSGALFLRKHFVFYFLVGFLIILLAIYYGVTFANDLSFFRGIMVGIAFFLLLSLIFEILTIYSRK